jgi:hypothetical protein
MPLVYMNVTLVGLVVIDPGVGGGGGEGGSGGEVAAETIRVTGMTTSGNPSALTVRADSCVPKVSPVSLGEGVSVVDQPEGHVPNAHAGVAS